MNEKICWARKERHLGFNGRLQEIITQYRRALECPNSSHDQLDEILLNLIAKAAEFLADNEEVQPLTASFETETGFISNERITGWDIVHKKSGWTMFEGIADRSVAEQICYTLPICHLTNIDGVMAFYTKPKLETAMKMFFKNTE